MNALGSSMASHIQVLIFPHEHGDLLDAMYDLSMRSKTRPKLRTLLTGASVVVHQQAARLNSPERAGIGSFEDLVELAERHVDQHRRNVIAEMVLLATVQVGQLLVYVIQATIVGV